MLMVGDVVKMVNPISGYEMLNGMKFKVTDIRDGAVYFTYDKSNTSSMIMYGSGAMSFNEFEKHFEIVKEEPVETKVTREWTAWKEIEVDMDEVCGTSDCGCIDCPYTTICNSNHSITKMVYRTNGKKVELRTALHDGTTIKSYAACNKADTFDLDMGLEVALARFSMKLAEHNFKKYVDSIE
jgi:hypothetical protein